MEGPPKQPGEQDPAHPERPLHPEAERPVEGGVGDHEVKEKIDEVHERLHASAQEKGSEPATPPKAVSASSERKLYYHQPNSKLLSFFAFFHLLFTWGKDAVKASSGSGKDSGHKKDDHGHKVDAKHKKEDHGHGKGGHH